MLAGPSENMKSKPKFFHLSTRKWAALIEIVLLVVMQTVQYLWYFLIISKLPNLGRLFANQYILTASTLVQVACTSLFTLGSLTKTWPLKFLTGLATILFCLAAGSFLVDISYSAAAGIETYVTQTVYWAQFNETVAITYEEKVYQGVSIGFYLLQAFVYDLGQIAVVAWLFKEPLRCRVCFGENEEKRVSQSAGFHELDEDDADDVRVTNVIETDKEQITLVLNKPEGKSN